MSRTGSGRRDCHTAGAGPPTGLGVREHHVTAHSTKGQDSQEAIVNQGIISRVNVDKVVHQSPPAQHTQRQLSKNLVEKLVQQNPLPSMGHDDVEVCGQDMGLHILDTIEHTLPVLLAVPLQGARARRAPKIKAKTPDVWAVHHSGSPPQRFLCKRCSLQSVVAHGKQSRCCVYKFGARRCVWCPEIGHYS